MQRRLVAAGHTCSPPATMHASGAMLLALCAALIYFQVRGVQPAVHLRHRPHHRQGHPGVHGRGEQAHQGGDRMGLPCFTMHTRGFRQEEGHEQPQMDHQRSRVREQGATRTCRRMCMHCLHCMHGAMRKGQAVCAAMQPGGGSPVQRRQRSCRGCKTVGSAAGCAAKRRWQPG